MGFGSSDAAKAARLQAEQAQKDYEQKMLEQKEAAILSGEEAAKEIAQVTVGSSDSYIDNPFTRKKRGKVSRSTNLGIV